MYGNIAKTYTANQAQGLNKAKQVALVLDRAIAALRDAKEAIDQNDVPRRLYSVWRARDVVIMLKGGLDFDQNERLARNLDTVYRSCLQDEVIPLLQPLRDAWHDAAAQLDEQETQNRVQAAPQQQPAQAQAQRSGLNLAT